MSRLYASLTIKLFGTIVLCGLLYVTLFPHTAAACDTFDVKCPVDVGVYTVVVGVAEGLWAWNRSLLYLARLIEGLRVWLISDVLGTALDATIEGVRFPFWIAAGIAWIVFTVSFLIQSVVNLNWVDLRKGVRNAILALVLFQAGSTAMASMEQIRVTVGQGFGSIAATSLNAARNRAGFYVGDAQSRADGIDTPHSIYDGVDGCPGVDLTRDQPNVMYMNDYLANFLFAEARDIHCPDGSGTAALPAGFINNFQIDLNQISNEDENARARRMILARMGMARQAQAALPVIGAVLEQVMHLVFALSLASIWFSLVISTMFSLFVPLETMWTGQIRAMMETLKRSWLATFWVSLGLALIGQAAATGNALAVNGVTIGMCAIVAFQIRNALRQLGANLGVAAQAVGNAPQAVGGAIAGFGGALGAATRFGVQAATVGGALALGGGPELGEQLIRQARRRLTFSSNGNLLVQAAQRTLLDHAMGPIEERVRDSKDARAIARGDSETAWYEQKLADPNTTTEEKDRALRRTAQIEGEQESIAARQLQRQIRYVRERGNWSGADRLMADSDAADIDRQDRSRDEAIQRLERDRDTASRAGDVRKAGSIQSRLDALRGASAAATVANGVPEATRADAIGAPLAPGLGEVTITRGADGQLRVNGRRVDGVSDADGKVVLSVAGQAVTLDDPEDYQKALQLQAGATMDAQAQISGPISSRAAVDVPASPARAAIQTRIEHAEARVVELSALRNQALEAKEWDKAHTAIADINTLKAQIATDRQALTAIDRAVVQVRVPTAPVATGGAAQLAPDADGAAGAVAANDLAYEPPPAAVAAPASPVMNAPVAEYNQHLAARRQYIEERERRLTALREQRAQVVETNPDQAAALAQRISQTEQYQRQDQETYNRIAARPPAGVDGVPQIVVGAPGLTAAPAAAPAQAAAAPQVVAAPAATVPLPPVAAAPQVVAPPHAPAPQVVGPQATPVTQVVAPPQAPIETPAAPLRPDMVPPGVAASVPPPSTATSPEAPRQAGWMPPSRPAAPAGPPAPAETPATPLRPDMVPPSTAPQRGGASGSSGSPGVQDMADRLSDKTQGAGGARRRPWKQRGDRPRGPRGTGGNGGTK